MIAVPVAAPLTDLPTDARFRYPLRHGDRALVLGQRLGQWVTHAPELEEEIALANLALDLLGQARALYTEAGAWSGRGWTEDDLAYWRDDRSFFNPLLVEQPNGDFAVTMVRQLLHDAWAAELWGALRSSTDPFLAGLAGKVVKETAYHLRHASAWVVRLGDGTDESRRRCVAALDDLWRFTGELFEADEVETELVAAGAVPDPASLREPWLARVRAALDQATLPVPADQPMRSGGRRGLHGEQLSHLLGELQVVARSHPGASW